MSSDFPNSSERQFTPKRVAESHTIMTEMVMPNDTNPMGNLMGGNLMRWMDVVCAICAGKHCAAQVVTASVDHVSFEQAIRLGDIVTLDAKVTRAFNSSVEVYVEVFASNIKGFNPRKANHAYFTFVAIDEKSGETMPVPPVIALTESEQLRYEGAPRRREVRLILSGRLKPENANTLREYLNQFSN